MKNISLIIMALMLSGCQCLNSETGYGLDGKAVGWCKRERRAEKLCKKHDGMKKFYYRFAECNDGTQFTDEVEKR